jgi:hypothetical protein
MEKTGHIFLGAYPAKDCRNDNYAVHAPVAHEYFKDAHAFPIAPPVKSTIHIQIQ